MGMGIREREAKKGVKVRVRDVKLLCLGSFGGKVGTAQCPVCRAVSSCPGLGLSVGLAGSAWWKHADGATGKQWLRVVQQPCP